MGRDGVQRRRSGYRESLGLEIQFRITDRGGSDGTQVLRTLRETCFLTLHVFLSHADVCSISEVIEGFGFARLLRLAMTVFALFDHKFVCRYSSSCISLEIVIL